MIVMPLSKALPDAPRHTVPRPVPAEIPPFVAMDMMRKANDLAASGRSVIHLETGQPSTAAPALVREAAARAIVSDKLGYTEATGLPALRARIARYYAERHGLAIDPSRVIATTGSSGGLMLAFLALTGPGGRIGMARPCYPCYRNIALALGMEPVEIPTSAEDGFQTDRRRARPFQPAIRPAAHRRAPPIRPAWCFRPPQLAGAGAMVPRRRRAAGGR